MNKDYEAQAEKNRNENEIRLSEFEAWLTEKGLTERTINSHIWNVRFYLNDFLNYYDANDYKSGAYMIVEFLGGWFIRKAMWSSKATIKSTAASIKKFYQCMAVNGRIPKESYEYLCAVIRECMPDWMETFDEYMCGNYESVFF